MKMKPSIALFAACLLYTSNQVVDGHAQFLRRASVKFRKGFRMPVRFQRQPMERYGGKELSLIHIYQQVVQKFGGKYMGHVIAVAGKGGVGKTTLCGLLIQYLCESGKKPVLAVDADANSNLNEVLGVETEITLGELREEIERAGIDSRYQIPAGVTKQDYLEMRLADAITEEDDYDLMVMGRTQGQGCYCFVNGLVQTQIQRLQSHYPYIVVDNEAGMEHISRGILPTMQTAILVSDCSRRGVQAAGRIARLVEELNFKPQKMGLIVNRAPEGRLDAGTMEEIEKQNLNLLGVVPHDDMVYRFDCDGKPTIQLPADSPVRAALKGIVEKLGL